MGKLVPNTIQDVNAFLDGKGYLGVTKDLQLPAIAQKVVETNGAVSADYAAGALEKMELSFKLNIIDANTFLAFGINTFENRVPLVFKGSIYDEGKSKPAIVVVTGDIVSITPSAWNAGEVVEQEIKVSVHFYSLVIDSIPVILVDAKNMICMIGGRDFFADLRANLT
ncbi:MAG: phage major tail tube protein [Campylobacteraceae bacterium]|jgi:P2 family phage contractile tail tube protein|nr:phage major tail tube protein [Campylobacteraceae bacterium]